ncbi:Lipid-A-disaccharide synthase [Hondaea fermentalgiana]|uniref:lipid-A-disaccharide synthase n=1 Tax=Hondaea fermentalgiana TaxID=2315210 RepID=A0A2R5GFV5_9STRA|nr:Lipid-A-disaccharide synthase [Hondaea fermentalgiana]|eukprot:GBG27523.1 Lipid-A-disaccharide synthase [Hondaea fermentalgiana]
MNDIAVMGLGSVLTSLPRIFMRLRRAEHYCTNVLKPHVVLTVDAKGFNLRLQRRLDNGPWRRMHIVGPSPWALKPLLGAQNPRTLNLARTVDQLFLLMPFERSWFTPTTQCTCIGHPALQAALPQESFAPADNAMPEDSSSSHACVAPAAYVKANPLNPWQRLSLADRVLAKGTSQNNIVAFFPGSRLQELRWALPLVLELAQQMGPSVEWRISTTPGTAAHIQEFLRHRNESDFTFSLESDPTILYRDAKAAVAVSGTIVTELAIHNVPSIVIYDADWLTRRAASYLARVDYVSLPNILADRAIIPEFIFENCTAARIAPALQDLLNSQAQIAKDHSGSQETQNFAHMQSRNLQKVLPHIAVWDNVSQKPRMPADIVAAALIHRFDELDGRE